MPKRTKRATARPEWAPTSHFIGSELHLLCIEERQPSGLTYGLTPPPAVYERRPIIKERVNAGRLLVAEDDVGTIYYAQWRAYGLHSARSPAYASCHIIPETASPLLVKLTLWEAQTAKEAFDAHIQHIAELHRQIQTARCKAGTHVGRVLRLVEELCPLPEARQQP